MLEVSAATDLIGECYRLQARNLEALAATHVLAAHDVILAQHVRTRLGKASTIAIVRPWRQLPFLGPDQPSHLVIRRLMAMRTVQGRQFLLRLLVKKISLIHV